MDIQTKDGILLRNIPDSTPDDVIKARIQSIRAGNSDSVKSEQNEIVERMSGEFGGLGEDSPSGSGARFGETLVSALPGGSYVTGETRPSQFRQAFIDRGKDAVRGVQQFFSGQENTDRIAREIKSEEKARQEYFSKNPDEAARYNLGQASEIMGESAAMMKAIPNLGKNLVTRSLYNAGVGGGLGILSPAEGGESSLSQAGKPALAGLGTSLLLSAVPTALHPIRSYQEFKVNNAKDTLVGKTGAALRSRLESQGTNPLMTLAEETQDPSLLNLQNTALQSSRGQKMAEKLNNQQLRQQRNMVSKLGTTSVDDLAETASSVGNERLDTLKAIRASRANNLYHEALSDVSTGKARTINLQSRLAEIETEFPGAGKMIREANLFVDRSAGEGATLADFARFESRLRGVASGKGTLTSVTKPPIAQERQIARRLHQALLDDIIDAGSKGQFPKTVVPKLQRAIKTYAQDSEVISNTAKTELNRILGINNPTGGTPTYEQIAEGMTRMKPDQFREALSWADSIDPTLRKKTAQYVIGTALDKAKDRVLAKSGQTRFDRATFLSEMKMPDRSYKLLFGNDKAAMQGIDDAISLMKRTYKDVRFGSGESAAQIAQEAIAVGAGTAGKNAQSLEVFGPKFLAKWLTGPILAKAAFDPNGQQALRGLAKTNLLSRANMAETGKSLAIIQGIAQQDLNKEDGK